MKSIRDDKWTRRIAVGNKSFVKRIDKVNGGIGENSKIHGSRRFVSTSGTTFSLCRKYLEKALPPKRLKNIHPVHSFEHSRAINMPYSGSAITDIKNHLGHDHIQSTTIYLQLDLNRSRHIQRQLIRHMQSVLTDDSKIEELLQWENEGDLMACLDSL